eukprot:TRINITY_DN26970_c0_g1_i1.p1 TRINITY_DN26970_c0_g1~~TRINITY_DN26970_c0_g1_i1.p1  ORF type:complete len:1067 (-),score=266.31 TRINITY_DN26970_c0_g1_i1:211-3411(-)
MTCANGVAICGLLTWDEFWPHIFFSLLQPIIAALLMLPLRSFLKKSETLKGFMHHYVGTIYDPPTYPRYLNIGYVLQLICSAVHCAIWISRTYTHEVTPATRLIEVIISVFFILHYIFNGLKGGFHPLYAFTFPALVDSFTITPVFLTITRPPSEVPWMSFAYLRAYRMVLAYVRIEATGVLEEVTELTRALIIVLLKTLSLVMVMGGTVMFLELLGDPEFVYNNIGAARSLETDMGSLSFVQMVYWIFTTISTVGYGDFSPQHVFSRIFVIYCIMQGVIFFSVETGNLMELTKLEDSGKGRFHPSQKDSDHIVVVGGGLSTFSSLIVNFIEGLFRNPTSAPNCVLMNTREINCDLKDYLQTLPAEARMKVKYFVGSAVCIHDLQRVQTGRAKLIVIICDVMTADPDQEDQDNIMRALMVKRAYPGCNIRLMLLRPESKARAIRVGIRSSRCLSMNEVKSLVMADSCRCRGWSTFITQLIAVPPDVDKQEPAAPNSWLYWHRRSLKMSVYGFCVSKKMVGKIFDDVVRHAFGHDVIVIGVQIGGKIFVNPSTHIMEEGDIMFGFMLDPANLAFVADEAVDWRNSFIQNQTRRRTRGSVTANRPVVNESMTEEAEKKKKAAPKKKSNSGGPGGFKHIWQPGALNIAANGGGYANGGMTSTGLGSTAVDSAIQEGDVDDVGGHILLLVLAGNAWQQMICFVQGLRNEFLPHHDPIIILSAVKPTADIINQLTSFEAVQFIVGNPLYKDTLTKVGVDTAKSITLMAGKPVCEDFHMVDGKGIMTLTMMESEDVKAPVILELLNEDSSALLQPFLPVSGLATTDNLQAEDDSFDMTKAMFVELPRLASGNIFCASMFGNLLASAYSAPGIMELIQGMTIGPAYEQNSFPWQVKIPEEFVGRPYAEFAMKLMNGYPEEGPNAEGAIPLGVFRRRLDLPATSDTMISLPPSSLELRDNDLVLVFASDVFGAQCYRGGILTCGGFDEEKANKLHEAGLASRAASEFGVGGKLRKQAAADGGAKPSANEVANTAVDEEGEDWQQKEAVVGSELPPVQPCAAQVATPWQGGLVKN